ncbi:SH3 domain-containing protein [Roseovarius sp. M141]|uniref:SH3 domain-containing protein n=1 Tax=Roseovarius sp. M141 TaxID=2583806 RepID=UPI0020CDF169|nr:SH3 domain-containing protein [Roseovarius sp. M141]MCQ0093213.1 SH3 domain-containing protein [Roseovarius sp. M141]
MKLMTLIMALSLTSVAAGAQQLDVEFQIVEDGHAAGCLGAMVVGLNPNGDGFLSVRTGPGTNYRKIDELYNGNSVRPCAKEGAWWGVYYGQPRRKGWVHGNWLGNWAG